MRDRGDGDVLGSRVLLLNRSYMAVSLTSVRRALVLVFGGAGRALDEHGETHDFMTWRSMPIRDGQDALPIVGGALRVPRVVYLTRCDRAPKRHVRLSRSNLMIRDDQQCQYCSRRLSQRDLNVDHVLPRCRGGLDSWDNLVVSCRACNLRKGHHTPREAGMTLLRAPREPHWTLAAQIHMTRTPTFAEWRPFLQ